MACSSAIQQVYSSHNSKFILYPMIVLTLALLIFGFVNIAMVLKKRTRFTNTLLGLFYVFTQATLLLRFIFYIYVICQNSKTRQGNTGCEHEAVTVTL